jgi:hypothetical protein
VGIWNCGACGNVEMKFGIEFSMGKITFIKG